MCPSFVSQLAPIGASCDTNPSMDALPANRSWQPSRSHGTYQHETIASRSRQLLMMGICLPETCSATSRREIKNKKMTSSWFPYPHSKRWIGKNLEWNGTGLINVLYRDWPEDTEEDHERWNHNIRCFYQNFIWAPLMQVQANVNTIQYLLSTTPRL